MIDLGVIKNHDKTHIKSLVPPLNIFPTDKTSQRSISLPASKINQLKRGKGINGEEIRIDISQVNLNSDNNTTQNKEILENKNDVKHESKARKIARYDGICSKISDCLYIGSDTIARDCDTLVKCGITHVLNCAGTICENYFPDQFIYKTLYLYDGSNENIDCLFYSVLDFMDSAISKGGVVYVHCHQGISRSSAMLILYLMWKKNQNFIKTHEFVKARREICNPNAGFTCQLLSWWSNRNSNDCKPRFFIITPHRKESFDTPVLREVSTISKDTLDSRGCFILLYNNDLIFYWKGSNAHMFLRKSSRKFVKLLQRFDNAPERVLKEKQGSESDEFFKYFPDLNPAETASISRNHEYDQYFDLLDLLSKSKMRKRKPRSLSEKSV